MDDLMTYDGWVGAGKKIKAGAVARFYLVSPDGTQSRAMFDEHQVVDVESMDGVWTQIVPADERPALRKAPLAPKIKLRYDTDGVLWVWCGPNQKMIASMKQDKFSFDKYSHRWKKKVGEAWFAKAQEAYTAAGFQVAVES